MAHAPRKYLAIERQVIRERTFEADYAAPKRVFDIGIAAGVIFRAGIGDFRGEAIGAQGGRGVGADVAGAMVAKRCHYAGPASRPSPRR